MLHLLASMLTGCSQGEPEQPGTTTSISPEGAEAAPPEDFVAIEPGSFFMGSEQGDYVWYDEELEYLVTLTRGFWILQSEVTQEQYLEVTGTNPSRFDTCPTCPVETVDWFDAVEYANDLSRLEGLKKCYSISDTTVTWPKGLDCEGYRLPTEAEWEFAARGGEGYLYAGSDEIDEVAWHDGNSDGQTHPVCEKLPNGYGLCDMSGNVSEWVWDWKEPYPGGSATDPVGPEDGHIRGGRGGHHFAIASGHMVGFRAGFDPHDKGEAIGFRLVRTIP